MANREDTIHIKIKLDIDAEDKEILTKVSENLAKTDEQGIKKVSIELTEEELEIQQDIDKIEKEIKNLKKEDKKKKEKNLAEKKQDLEVQKDRILLRRFKTGNVGKLNQLSSEHFANLKRAAVNPGQFLLGAFTKKLGKVGGALAKGGIVGIIALLVYETVLFVLDLFMQPGRFLDRRFKRIARLETMNFYERTLQEEIRHGYQEIRVTTMQGLRGGASQVNGNLFEFSSGATGIIQSSPYRSSQDIYQSQNSNGNTTDSQGNPRRRNVFFNGR